MDIQPLSKGHAVRTAKGLLLWTTCNPLTHTKQLVIPKFHGEKLADIPDEHLTELLVRFFPPQEPL